MSGPIIDLPMAIAILMNEAAGETLPKNFLAMEVGSSINPYQFRSFLEKVIEKAEKGEFTANEKSLDRQAVKINRAITDMPESSDDGEG